MLTKTETEEQISSVSYLGNKSRHMSFLSKILNECLEKRNYTRFVDLFAGTCSVGKELLHNFEDFEQKVVVFNDTEYYSYILAKAYSSPYTNYVQDIIENINKALDKGKRTQGVINNKYSTASGKNRMFFTEDNASMIDYTWNVINKIEDGNAKCFLLGSLLASADTVANVYATYGAYSKTWILKAKKTFKLVPLHRHKIIPNSSHCVKGDALKFDFQKDDLIFIDPPYSKEQYSRHYFLLNIILNPTLATRDHLKTGQLLDNYASPFCSKNFMEAFKELFTKMKGDFIMTYNTAAVIPQEELIKLVRQTGRTVKVVEMECRHYNPRPKHKSGRSVEYVLICEKCQKIE